MMKLSRPGSRKQSEGSTSIGSTNKYEVTPQFDTWSLFKRSVFVDPYVLTTKYRTSKTSQKRAKSAVIKRNRRRPDSRADSELGWDSSSRSQTTATDYCDLDKEFPDDFDYDGEPEELFGVKKIIHQSPAQEQYKKACKKFNILPSAYFHRHLENHTISMKYRVLGPDGAKACAIALVSNSTVHTLDLTGNDIGPLGASYIAELLKENHFINHLSLNENHIGIEGAKLIIKVVTECDSIVALDLSGNDFKEHEIKPFIELFEETRNLKSLSLSHNEFREFGNFNQELGDAIEWNDNLEELDLSWNHIRRKGATTIGESLEMNTCLKKLNVSWNGFYLEGCKALSKALEINKTLQELDLSANRIDKECLDKLLAGLKKNKTLKVLKLAWNPITSVGAMSILNMLNETETTAIKKVDIHTQHVEMPFLKLAEKLWNDRQIEVIHGPVYGLDLDSIDEDEQVLIDANPVIVLIEFGKLMGFRLMDLFAALDKDGSKSLSKSEIRNGLKFANIPLTDKNLERLIEKLDIDKDGEIDFSNIIMSEIENLQLQQSELMTAKDIHRKHVSKMMKAIEMEEDLERTEVGRIRATLQRLMAKMMKGNPAFKSRVSSFNKILHSGNYAQVNEEIAQFSNYKSKHEESTNSKNNDSHDVNKKVIKKKLTFKTESPQDTSEYRVLH
ncbi:hypothetical protein KUTeg_024316 [Tegillarca granosa]|uniref:EF-hand domain-containing protein n=1 Tax=Tegillarca granosa TaxID=220873 RepID=A0ABQ9DY16_TEGGR|nr:hypothetical protein KUTeg_024316 [Tegillarca granosa]